MQKKKTIISLDSCNSSSLSFSDSSFDYFSRISYFDFHSSASLVKQALIFLKPLKKKKKKKKNFFIFFVIIKLHSVGSYVYAIPALIYPTCYYY